MEEKLIKIKTKLIEGNRIMWRLERKVRVLKLKEPIGRTVLRVISRRKFLKANLGESRRISLGEAVEEKLSRRPV